MTYRHPRFFGLAIFVLGLFATTGDAADNVLKAVPDNAYLVAYVNQVEDANAKLKQFGEMVAAPIPDLFQILRLSPAIEKSLNKAGAAGLAILPGEQAGLSFVGFVPVTDFDALVKELGGQQDDQGIAEVTIAGRPMTMARKGDFAVMAIQADKPVVAAVAKSKNSMAKQVQPLRSFLKGADVSVVVATSGVKLGMQQALTFLEIMKGQMAQAGEEVQPALAGLQMYESLFHAIEEHVTHFGIAAKLQKDGSLRVASRTVIARESRVGETAENAPLPPTASLKHLPPGPFLFAFSGTTAGLSSEEMMRWSLEVWQNMLGADEIEKEKLKKIVEATKKSMEGVRAIHMVFGVGQADQPLYGGLHFAIETEDAQAYLDRYEEMVALMKQVSKDKPLPIYGDIELETVKTDGIRTLKVAMNVGAVIPGQDEKLADVYKNMFGGDKLVAYLAAANKTTVVGAYTSQDQLLKALDVVRSSQPDLSIDKDVAKTTQMLDADAHWRAYLSIDGTVQFIQRSVRLFAPEGAVPQIPDFPASPPIGVSVKIQSEGVDTETVISGDTLRAIGSFVRGMRQPNPN